ncbi:MAG: RNA polymerase sigma factor [Salinivirgaceae bacterium]|nr:RNA polymerase sigma factor [Salinivirgaceae bacterium]
MKNNLYQLIEKCKNGEVSSKEWVYRKYSPILLGVCLRYIKDRMEAEDVLHEGFITIYEKIYQFEHKGSFEGWLKRIIVNKALNHIKTNVRTVEIDDLNEPWTMDNEENDATNIKEIIIEADFSREEILEIIQELPDGFRTVFNLYVFENFQHKEIAKQLNISVGTSKSQLLRARKLIQKKLHEKVLEKNPKKNKKLITYVAFLVMNNKLNYIDTVAKNKLEGFAINPTTPFKGFEISNSAISNATLSNSVIGNIKSQLIALTAKKIALITTVIVATGAIILIGIQNDSNITPVQMEPIVVISDSIEIKDIEDNLELISVESELTKPKIEVEKRKGLPVKKTIIIKRSKIIRETIKIIDTIELK